MYIVVGGPELQKVVEEPRAIIEQLQPNAAYMFYVVAYNERSASQHSEPITQMTLEDGRNTVLCLLFFVIIVWT